MIIISSTETLWALEQDGITKLIPKSVTTDRVKALAIIDADDPWNKRTVRSVIMQGWTPKGVAADAQGVPCNYNHPQAVVWSLAGAMNLVYEKRSSMLVVAVHLMTDWMQRRRGAIYDNEGRTVMKLSMNMPYEDQLTMLAECHL